MHNRDVAKPLSACPEKKILCDEELDRPAPPRNQSLTWLRRIVTLRGRWRLHPTPPASSSSAAAAAGRDRPRAADAAAHLHLHPSSRSAVTTTATTRRRRDANDHNGDGEGGDDDKDECSHRTSLAMMLSALIRDPANETLRSPSRR